MSRRHESIHAILVALSLSSALLLFLGGCGKQEPGASPSSSEQTTGQTNNMMGHDDGAMDMSAEQMTANANAAALAGIEQKTCPVMEGNPIDPNVFVEYEGQKVYFCCTSCKAKFLADPNQYVAKLPQFQQ